MFVRFRRGYCRHNPRRMVRTWAEKEIRNLVRMHSEGLPVPSPIMLRGHVLLMDFIGKDGWPAPKLKVATAVLVRTVLCACRIKWPVYGMPVGKT
jgi:serine/threonine-protein kinase RIO1